MNIVTSLPADAKPAETDDLFTTAILFESGVSLKHGITYYRKFGDAYSVHTTGTHTHQSLLFSDIKLGWIYVRQEFN